MKSAYALLVIIGFIGIVTLAADKAATSNQNAPSLAGTWESTGADSDHKALKFVTDTHWIWVWIDPKTKRITTSMGGRYEQKGDSYIETPEFATEGLEPFLGKAQKFTAKLEGDRWNHSGELSNGQRIDEVWKRVK